MNFSISILITVLLCFRATAQTNIQHILKHNSINREYTVHLPTGYNSLQNYPLVINMHGMGGDISTHMLYSNFNTIADTGNFIVVYPQGLTGTTSWGQTATQWDSYFGTGTKDLEFLDTLIDRMYYDYSIDLKKVYSTGHSNGGFMSYRLACELSGRIAAIASVAGAMTFQQENNCNLTHPMPILQFHGTMDQTVLFTGQPLLHSSIPDLMSFWKSKNHCNSDSTVAVIPDISVGDSCNASVTYFSTCDSLSQVQLYTITDGGHSWPGSFPYPPLGNTCLDFNASSVIWNFFNQHQLDNPIIPEDTTKILSVNVENLEKIEIYPNPFNHEFKIKLPKKLKGKITYMSLRNVHGIEVLNLSLQLSEKEIVINSTNLSSGIYSIVGEGIESFRLIKN